MRIKSAPAAAVAAVLLAGLLSACSGSDGTATTTGPMAADGATLLQDRCTGCHTLDRVTAEWQSENWWAETVLRMIDRGAQLSEEEQATLTAYLAETYGP